MGGGGGHKQTEITCTVWRNVSNLFSWCFYFIEDEETVIRFDLHNQYLLPSNVKVMLFQVNILLQVPV